MAVVIEQGAFDGLEPTPKARPARRPEPPKVYAKRFKSANPPHCETCAARTHKMLVERTPGVRAPRRAAYEISDGTTKTLLCYAHGEEVKATLGLGRK